MTTTEVKYEKSITYNRFKVDTKYKTIEKLIDFEEYNSSFTKEDIEDIKVKIFQKVHTLLGVNHD